MNIFNFFKENTIWYIAVMLMLFLLSTISLSKPSKFVPTKFVVEEGSNVSNIAESLKRQKAISSANAFKILVYVMGKSKSLQPGLFEISEPMTLISTARLFTSASRNQIIVRIPEGSTRIEIAEVFEEKLPFFNTELFMRKTEDKEGVLFPDTYIFSSVMHTDGVIDRLVSTFYEKTEQLVVDVGNSDKSMKDIIIMASLIEKEAHDSGQRKEISGILWKRISLGMPLQVDVSLDTYEGVGLPEKPISNPSLDSLYAAAFPRENPYYFYLHDKNGNIYYGRNFDEHQQNAYLHLN